MPPAGTEAALGSLLITHAGFQVLAQQIQTVAGSGRKANGYMAIVADFQGNGFSL
jgi:hypothetical protein